MWKHALAIDLEKEVIDLTRSAHIGEGLPPNELPGRGRTKTANAYNTNWFKQEGLWKKRK